MQRVRCFRQNEQFNFPASACSKFMLMSRVQPIVLQQIYVDEPSSANRVAALCSVLSRQKSAHAYSRILIGFFASILTFEFRVHRIRYK
jgi:hypothetical protein